MTRRGIAILAVAIGAIAIAGARRAREPELQRRVARGEAAAERGAGDVARRDFEVALAIDRTDPAALEGLARLAEQAGDRAGAATGRQAIAAAADGERWPLASRATAWRNAGLAALRAGDHPAAVQALQHLRDLEVSTLETDLTLAAIQLARGELDARTAEDIVARYGQVEPTWRLALAARAQRVRPATLDDLLVFLMVRRADETAVSAPAAAGIAPVAAAVAAQARARRGDVAGAQQVWGELRDGPLTSLAALELAKLAIAGGDPVAARAWLDAARADRDLPCETWFYQQARALQIERRLDAARVAADSAIDCNPLAVRSIELLAAIETERGQSAAAEDARRLAQALQAAAANPTAGATATR